MNSVGEDCRWQEFFNDPTQWWDNRAKHWDDYPDFKHVKSGRGLWINSLNCPRWVTYKLNSLKEASHSQNARAQYKEDSVVRVKHAEKATEKEQKPTVADLLTALKNCSRTKDLEGGRQIHAQVSDSGLSSNVHLLTSLINMYGKCGSMVDARNVFATFARPNVVAWNCLIWGYVDNGENEVALELYDGVESPDGRTFVAALSACSALASRQKTETLLGAWGKWLEKGKAVHSRAVERRCCDIFVESSLVDMYSRCGSMPLAREVFDGMVQRNVVSWNALLQGYVENGEPDVALKIFYTMDEGEKGGCVTPNTRTFVAAISACASLAVTEKTSKSRAWLEEGRKIYARAVKKRCSDVYVENTLLDMFARCGWMTEARRVFDQMNQRNVVSWTALLQGYSENDQCEVALEMFNEMKADRLVPNARTFVAVLSACASLAAREEKNRGRCLVKGKTLHSMAAASKCCDSFVENTLIDMYAKCGSMFEARRVFECMVRRNVVSWTALIMGYAENGENERALEMVAAMDSSGVARNSTTYVAALTACGNLMALENGEAFHADIRRSRLDKDVVVANCLVDFYGKCGSMEAAKQVFDSISGKTLVSWNSLMCGYSFQGDADGVFWTFERMREDGFRPNEVTFVCLLTACSHAGLTDKGKELFEEMDSKYGISPNIKHYACMVDLLGRANYLDEALAVVRSMKFEADAVIWTTLLGACKKWKNVDVARVAFESFVKMCGRDSSAYVLMADIFRAADMREECERLVQKHRQHHQKEDGTVWIDEYGTVHRFVLCTIY